MLRLASIIVAVLPLGAADFVSFKLVEKIPVVTVYLNRSGPYRMIVDTGSSLSLLDQRIASKLDIPQIRRTTMVTPRRNRDAGGQSERAERWHGEF